MKFISRKIVAEQSSLAIVRTPKVSSPQHKAPELVNRAAKKNQSFSEKKQLSAWASSAPRIEALIVFVGYWLTVHEMNYDDSAGLDLRGKVVLLLSGGPIRDTGPLRKHNKNARWEALKRAGVIGVIGIQDPIGQDIPWDRSKLARLRPALSLAEPHPRKTRPQRHSARRAR